METRRCALVTPPSTHAVVCIGSLVVAVGAVVAAYWRGRRDGSGMMSERRLGGGIAARTSSAATTAPTPPACGRVYDTIADMIGGTPMLRVSSLSRATGCSVYLKMESSNPAGSSKDRIARQIIEEAVHDGRLQPGGWVVEGTSGSTGVSLALLCRTLGYRCVIVMPDDQAAEKIHLLRSFGALVHVVKPAAIVNTNHYVNVARRVAQALSRGECIGTYAPLRRQALRARIEHRKQRQALARRMHATHTVHAL
ncbi:pyridoxal-phosphate dependent enzyme [archaeon]|nr:MAG: pyridoxal-phosphate dependent enzyme [archaeon]